jgi:hypothetical protein
MPFNTVYFETQPLQGVIVVNNIASRLMVGNVHPVAVDGNHVTMVKPKTRKSVLYLAVKEDLQKAFSSEMGQ